MDLLDLVPYVCDRLIVFILVFSRIAALFSTFVLFRQDMINSKIIISLTSILTLFVLVYLGNTKVNIDVFSLQMILKVLFQVFIGFIAGLILNIVFEIFNSVGQIISTQIGLSLASVFDPKLGSITTLTQFYMISVTMMFLLLNGHLFLIDTMVKSFASIPLDNTTISTNLIKNVLSYSGIIFSGSIVLSITVIVAILSTNFALALMSKFAPQFNLFSIGINMSLVLGLICVYITFDLLIDRGSILLQDALNYLKTALLAVR